MNNRIFKKIDKLPNKGVGKFEWLLFALLAAFCYIFFCHQDILITAGHSIEYLNGHITDFYSACKKTDGAYTANYLPSTFILFAIWNIPMKLFGFEPTAFGDWNTVFMLWNKILPTAAYFLSGAILYKICRERLNFDKKKSALAMFLAFTAPTAFFTQFIFCQYDIFTVLFMLLGMYYYFKQEPKIKDWALFALFFGIATTFKYFAVLIFTVLLLLRVKDVVKALLLLALSAAPAGLEAIFYFIFDFKAFKKSVFGFSALDYTSGFSIDLGTVSINLMIVFIVLLIAFSYFTKTQSFEEVVGFGMFYSCGICFAIFGMMLWHPQWLLFIVPFWTLSTVINKNYKILILLDALFGLVFLVYIVNQFSFTLEGQGLMRYGALMDTLRYKISSDLKMADIFIFKNTDILFSLISSLLLIGFVFKHPKFNMTQLNDDICDGRFVVNIRFLAFAAAFLTASLAALPGFADSADLLWRTYDKEKKQTAVTVNCDTYAEEHTRLDKMKVNDVYAVFDSAEKSDEKAEIYVDIIEAETNKVVAKGSGKEKNIKNGSFEFTRLELDEPFISKDGEEYIFRYYTSSEKPISLAMQKGSQNDLILLRTYQKDYSSAQAYYNGEAADKNNIAMKLTGSACVK